MKIQARIESASVDAKTKEALLTLRTSDTKLMPMLPTLENKELTVELKDGKKRSLSANAYAWVLIDKLAEKTRIPKTDIYRQIIRDMGGVSVTGWFYNHEVGKLKETWESNGIGWIVDIGEEVHGKTYVELYYGSSCYDTKQMSRMLDLLKTEAELQGIQVQTPSEVANMLSLWSTA